MSYTVIFESPMPQENPFKVESKFGKPISISWGNANHTLDLIEEAIEEGASIDDLSKILESRYHP